MTDDMVLLATPEENLQTELMEKDNIRIKCKYDKSKSTVV